VRRLVGVAVLVAVLASCSGDDSSVAKPSTTTTTVTLTPKAAFIAAADVICGSMAGQIKSLGKPSTMEETALYIQERIAINNHARDDLAALHPPADGADVQHAILDAIDGATAKATEAEAAAKRNDTAALGPLLDASRVAGQSANLVADAYGFVACGSR
jgi:hypothetical protein